MILRRFFSPLSSERADLFDWILPPPVKICRQGITGVRQIRGAAPSWQRNNAVLFDFCFEQHLAVATRFVTTVTTSGIHPSSPPYSWRLLRDLPAQNQTIQVSDMSEAPCISCCPPMHLAILFLASPLPLVS